MKQILLIAAFAMASFATAFAGNVDVTDTITSNTTWNSNNIYTLKGYIFVKSGATLTIQEGTIIKGDKTSQGSLIICRGAKIMAQGSKNKPIVFTSDQTKGNRKPGDWGGLIILGAAPVNNYDATTGWPKIEGFPALANLEVIKYGGTNASDNSGTLSYVRVEFAGIAYTPNNEINGITFGGVGNGTTVDHLCVYNSGDDSYEWFGGTVNCKFLVANAGTDDDFDTDNGFSGHLQYGIGIRDKNIFDAVSGGASHGFEIDNDANSSYHSPYTSAVISNFTMIGPLAGDTGTTISSNWSAGARLRRNMHESIFNTVFLGWNKGFYLDGIKTKQALDSGLWATKNNLIAGYRSKTKLSSDITSFDYPAYLIGTGMGNVFKAQSSDADLTDPFSTTAPNFLPKTGSVVLGAGSFSDSKLGDAFFNTAATFMGAMGTTDWTDTWVIWDPQNFDYSTAGVTTAIQENNPTKGVSFSAPTPNPTSGITTITFNLNQSQKASVNVYDITGKLVQSLGNKLFTEGKNTITTDVSTLARGLYIVRFEGANTQSSVRLNVVR
ncbi:MAG: T9SS type A sorting domain-containing protein [Bacteroidetes bacterium]|nr:T9SS type A sorting domain-containing protein [Bacteroidota bacterium]